jgi:hypothetical protein
MEYTGAICRQVQAAKARGWNYILSEHNTPKDLVVINQRMRTMLHSVGKVADTSCTMIGGSSSYGPTSTPRWLEIRSVRRGGLQVMAMAGMSYEAILEFSKHRDLPMLLRYLDDGAKSLAHRDHMTGLLRLLEDGRQDRITKARMLRA